ncbi:MAG: Rieske 2Fe-2S domain-containing protein [Actinomycetes bacterium]
MPHHTPSKSEVTRRAVVAGTGVLAVSATLAACSSDGNSAPPAQATPEPAAPRGQDAPPAGQSLASTTAIPVGGGAVFPSQQVVVTQPVAGTFKAFSAICTHSGCMVNKVAAGTINCPCHGSKYDIKDGSVVDGPAPDPLAERKITVSGNAIQLA